MKSLYSVAVLANGRIAKVLLEAFTHGIHSNAGHRAGQAGLAATSAATAARERTPSLANRCSV